MGGRRRSFHRAQCIDHQTIPCHRPIRDIGDTATPNGEVGGPNCGHANRGRR